MIKGSKKNIWFINVGIGISIGLIIFLVVIGIIRLNLFREKGPQRPSEFPSVSEIQKEIARYKVEPMPEKKDSLSKFERMFDDNPREDVGGDATKAWRRVPKETKKEIASQLNKEIMVLERELNRRPDDKKVKHKLKISKMLKKVVESDFDASRMRGIKNDEEIKKK